MNTGKAAPRLFRRLLWSHLGVTACVAAAASLAIVALSFFVEDGAYRAIVQSALARALQGESSADPVRLWRLEDAPEPWRELASGLPDGTAEFEIDGAEQHLALGTDPRGKRWIAVLESADIVREPNLALGLAAALAIFSILAMGIGYRVARRTLAPLERLTASLTRADPPPRPDELRAATGDDEVGLLADRIAAFVEQREQALEREREFLRDASHELRNPLSVLHGGIELLRESGTGDAQRFTERLERMDRSVARMRRTVEGLLTLARQESAAAHATDRPLLESVRELIAEMEPLAGPEVQMRLHFHSAPPGSPVLWIVILRNLLDNAVRATERGAIEVELKKASVTVSDSGSGLDIELLEKVPQAFVQGHSGGGFGLGISIVHRLALRLGWKLEFQSSPDGTSVELRAPLEL